MPPRARFLLTVLVAAVLAFPVHTADGASTETWPSGDGATADVAGPEGENGWFTGTVTVTIDDSSSNGRVKYRVDGGAWDPYKAPFDVAREGEHLVEFGTQRAINDGDVGGARFGVDTAPPVTVAAVDGREATADDEDLGWFPGATRVTLNASDTASGVRGTVFRLNGGAWTTYDGAFDVVDEGRYELRYGSTDHAGHEEATRLVEWGVDGTPPVTTATAACDADGDPVTGWCRGNATLTLAASDDASGVRVTRYDVNGGSSRVYEGPVTFPGDGVFDTVYASEDHAGNVETARTTTLHVDATAPVVSWNLDGPAGANGWFTGPVNATIIAADATAGVATVEAAVDGAPFEPVDGGLHLDGDGVHEVRVRATDHAGNVALAVFEVPIDGVTPVTTATLTGDTWAPDAFATPVEVALDAAPGPSGSAGTFYALGDVPFSEYAAPFDVTASGAYTLSYYTRDGAGTEESVRTRTFTVDVAPPETRLLVNGSVAPRDGTFNTSARPVIVALEATDDVSGVAGTAYRVGDASFVPYEEAFALDADGVYEITYGSTDQAGHEETVATTRVVVDTVPPETTLTVYGEEGKDGWILGYPGISLDAVDAGTGVDRVHYRVDDGPLRTYTAPFRVHAGEREVTYYAVDNAGKTEAARTRTVRGDASPPVTEAHVDGTQGSGGWYTSAPTVTFTATDDASGVNATYARIGDGDPFRVDGPVRVEESGVVNVTYWSTDHVERAESPRRIVLKVDAEPPTVDVTVSGVGVENGTYAGAALVSFDGHAGPSGLRHVIYRVDGGAWAFAPGYRPVIVHGFGERVVEAVATNQARVTGPPTVESFRVAPALPGP